MSTVLISAQIEKSIKDDLRELCKRTHRSQSDCVGKALADFLAREREHTERVQEGIDAANRGEMIDDETIDEWLSSWGTENELQPPEAIRK